MPEFTYETIEFHIAVREGFYRYRQKVSPAYLVTDTDIPWASIVVHRKPGTSDDQWFISEFVTGGAIHIPDTTDRDAAVRYAIAQIKALGRKGYAQALGAGEER